MRVRLSARGVRAVLAPVPSVADRRPLLLKQMRAARLSTASEGDEPMTDALWFVVPLLVAEAVVLVIVEMRRRWRMRH